MLIQKNITITLHKDTQGIDTQRFNKYFRPLAQERYQNRITFVEQSSHSSKEEPFIVAIEEKRIEEITLNKLFNAIDEALGYE